MEKRNILFLLTILISVALFIFLQFFVANESGIAMPDAMTLVAGVFASASALYVYTWLKKAKEPQAGRFKWLFIGLLAWNVADLIAVCYDLLQVQIPPTSLADVFWLLGYLPLTYSLFLGFEFIETRARATKIVLATYVLLCLAIVFLLSGSLIDYTASPLDNLVDLAYVMLDILLFSFALSLTFSFFSLSRGGRSWLMLTFAILLTSIGDLLFLQFSALNIPDAATLSSLFFILDYVWLGFSALIFLEERKAATMKKAPGRRLMA